MIFKNFQTFLLILFGLFAVGAIFIFSGRANKGGGQAGEITLNVWGIFPARETKEALNDVAQSKNIKVVYTEKTREEIDADLSEAIAVGESPDMIILPDDLLYKHREKLAHIPPDQATTIIDSFSQTYVRGADVFIDDMGVAGTPFLVDPMIMYVNQDMIEGAGYVEVPELWNDEFLAFVRALTKYDSVGTPEESGIALGEYANISFAKEMIETLFFQSGNPIGQLQGIQNTPKSFLTERGASWGDLPSRTLRFYLGFSNPSSGTYTWSSANDSDSIMFSANDLALFFAPASQKQVVSDRNPNMTISYGMIPQVDRPETERKAVSGTVYGLVIPKASKNQLGAGTLRGTLVSQNAVEFMADVLELAPAQRGLLAKVPKDDFGDALYRSALITDTWLDPDPEVSSELFRLVIDQSITGQKSVESALSSANGALSKAYEL